MSDNKKSKMKRRKFLKVAGGAAATATVAGCLGGGDGGDGGDGGTDGGTDGGDGPTEIIPGTATGFPPFEMKEGGEIVGFDIDLLEAVVDNTDDYTLAEWKDFDFDSLIPALTNENIDVIAAAMTITEDRDQQIDFTDPYYSADQSVLVAEGGDFSPGELDDLSGKRVGAQSGTTGASLVQENLVKPGKVSESNFKRYDSYVLAVQDLENGNIDAVVLDKPVAETFASERNVTVAFTVTTGEQYGFGIRQGASDLQSALNSGLEEVRNSGRYQEITNKWFGQE